MGEWSKKVGEVGEEIVGEFLNLIGWGDSQKGLTLPCSKGQNHGNNKSPKTTHGIDYLFSYESQLVDRTLENLVISVKYTSNAYPPSPNTKFKEHFFDLAKTIECFKRSEIRKTCNSHFSSVDRARNIGVLFWLSHDTVKTQDIIQQVTRVRSIDENNYDLIYIVDNKRVSFIYDTIKHLKNFRSNSEIEFFYPGTGKNNNPLNKKTSGKILPVDFLNSGILLIKLINPDNTKTLVISVIDEFDKNNFKRLMGLALNIMQDFAQDSLILFPHYEPLLHENQVNEAKSSFRDRRFTDSVFVSSFKTDFRTCEANIDQKLSLSNSQKQVDRTEFNQDANCINVEQFLPYGEMLRVFMEQSFISKGDLKELLRNRGVFTFNNEKQDTIPILTSTILTPNEFNFLRENQNSREDNPKIITQTIKWQSEHTLLDSIPEQLNVNSILNLEFANYKVIREPEFVPVDSNPDHVRIDFSVERKDLSKSWATETKEFKGSLELMKIPGTDIVKIVTTYTAKETQQVASKVSVNLLKNFKDAGNVDIAQKIEKIIFSSFTNPNRINYLFSLTKDFSSSQLEFVDIVDIKFSPDNLKSLPKDLEWMQGKIEDLKLNGKALHSTWFFEAKYCNFLHLYNVDSRFRFNLKFNETELKGECVIAIGFPDYEQNKDNTNSEIEINIKSMTLEVTSKGLSRSEIKEKLLKEIEERKINNFQKYKIDQNKPELAIVSA